MLFIILIVSIITSIVLTLKILPISTFVTLTNSILQSSKKTGTSPHMVNFYIYFSDI